MKTALTCALTLMVSGCLPGTSEDAFIGSADHDLCEGVWLACKGQSAGCIIDGSRYLSGTFPGERKFLVETAQGDWKIQVRLFLKDRLSPGTETLVSWYEPGCTDEYKFKISEDHAAGDLFEQAGKDQVFEVERAVVEPGDHLVTIWSDSVCRYLLRVDVLQQ